MIGLMDLDMTSEYEALMEEKTSSPQPSPPQVCGGERVEVQG
jgi:hypothetical protein